MVGKIVIQVFFLMEAQIFAANFECDHFFIRESRGKTPLAEGLRLHDSLVMFTNETINMRDKIVAVH